MSDKVRIEQGINDSDQFLRLLDDGFDKRTREHVEWKYNNFPDFETDHVFTVWDGEELIAIRRLVYRELVIRDGTLIPLFVGSDFVVHPDHRDRGIFTTLLRRTNRYERQKETQLSMSFNRRGYVTYESKLLFEWKYRSLALHVRVFNPENAIPHYASLAIEDSKIPDNIFEKPVISSIVSATSRLLPRAIVTSGVELASSDNDPRDILGHFKRNKQPQRDDIIVEKSLKEDQIKKVQNLYSKTKDESSPRFRREKRDIEHMLSHPQLEAVGIVEEGGEIIGFASLVVLAGDDVTEARVLDIVATDEGVFRGLLARISQEADDAGADLVSLITERDPGQYWAQVDKQMMMWDWKGDGEDPIERVNLKMGFYDVT